MILVSGAGGKTGLSVASAMARQGHSVRALVFRVSQRAAAEAAGAHQVVIGDMRERTTWARATEGARAVYHIAPNMAPDEVQIGHLALAACKHASLEHFVFHSVLHPQTEEMPHHWLKLRVEEALLASGLPLTILQPAAYMQNILGSWDTIVRQGRYQVPYATATRLSLVDLNDVAEAAAMIIRNPVHFGATYELVGPDAPSQVDVAITLSEVLGRQVEAVEIDRRIWRQNAERAGLGQYQVETLLKMFAYYERSGFLGNGNVLRWLLGRPPTDLRTFLARYASTHGPG